MRKSMAIKFLLLSFIMAGMGMKAISQNITWNFTNATAPSSAPPSTNTSGVTVSDISQGNNNGTTPLISTTSASSGYTGASGGNNAGAAARIGILNTAAAGSAYFEFTLTPAAGNLVTL